MFRAMIDWLLNAYSFIQQRECVTPIYFELICIFDPSMGNMRQCLTADVVVHLDSLSNLLVKCYMKLYCVIPFTDNAKNIP